MMRPAFVVPALALLFCASVSSAWADSFRFKADTMTGRKSEGREFTVLSGRAEVVSGSLTLRAQRIELSGKDYQFVSCSGDVVGIDTEKGIYLQTDDLKYDRTSKIARLEGASVLEDKKNSVVAKGRFIEYNDVAELVLIEVGVRILKEDLVARSDYALYRRGSDSLELAGSPTVFKNGDTFKADRMTVDLKTKDISMLGTVSGAIED